MNPADERAAAGSISIRGPRLLLRAFRPDEIDEEWLAMVAGHPDTVPELPDESAFKGRLARSGQLSGGWLDLAIDRDGERIGRIQTYVPPDRELPPGTFEMGIGLREDARGQGYGSEALALLTGWLFGHAEAEAVQGATDPANIAMRTVLERSGWTLTGTLTELGREWVHYRITRQQWRPLPAGRLRNRTR